MTKKILSFILLSVIAFTIYAQEVKPYEEIAKAIQMHQTSVQNPVYQIPCGTVNMSTYLQSAISVGNAVTNPLSYFTQKPPGNYYVNCSRDIAIVERGKSFELRLTANVHPTSDKAYTYAYADWNRDANFETDLGRNEITERTSNKTPGNIYVINVPADAELGKTRIRILLVENDATMSPTAPMNKGYVYDLVFYVTQSNNYENLLVTASSNNPNWGNAIITTPSPTNDGRYPHGSNITLEAIKQPTTTFLGWSDGTKIVSQDATYTFTADSAAYLIAVFETPRATLESPQTSTAEAPIWYQIKNAQTDSRLNTFIAYTPGSATGYDTHLEKPEDFSDKFLWRLEASTNEMVKIINRNSNMQLYSTGNLGETVTTKLSGSDFFVTPSGHANGTYSIQYNKVSSKLLNGEPTSRLLLYRGGLGTGSGWYFYRVPDDIFAGISYIQNPTIKVYTKQNELIITGTNTNERINVYNLLGENFLSFWATEAESRKKFLYKGVFVVTVLENKQVIHSQKIIN